MPIPIYNLRSGTANKRPASSGLAFGQIAINYNEEDPAIYFRGSSDDIIKIGPVYVGSGAPNVTPASGGASGNTVGEQWLDITNGDYVTKVWDGTAWRSPVITSSLIKDGTIVDGDISGSAAISLSKLATGSLPSGITVSSDNIVNGTIVNADISASAAIALSKLETGSLPSGITVSTDNIVAGTITDSDISNTAGISLSKLGAGALPGTITVDSSNIANGTITNDDISASAAIADTKLATISTAGKVSGNAITSGTISGSTAINTTGSIVTSGNATVRGQMAIGQASATANTEVDLAGTFAQTVVAVGASDIDCSTGNYFTKSVNGSITFTVSNVPASRSYAFMIEIEHISGTITWFSGVEWPGGTPPTLATGKTHLFAFHTDNGGSRWRANSLINYTT